MTEQNLSENKLIKDINADLLAALKECSFRLGTLVAACGLFIEVDARALDAAIAAIARAEGRS